MSASVALVFIIPFIIIFGIFYLYFSTRNKERLALIEKGADAAIFFTKKENRKTAPFWKVFILNLSLLLAGIGFGLISSTILMEYFEHMSEGTAVGCVFFSAGAFLFLGFNITKKLDRE